MPRLDRKSLACSASVRGACSSTGTSSPRSASGPLRGRPVCGRDDGANTQRMTSISTPTMPTIHSSTLMSKPTGRCLLAPLDGHRPPTDIVPEGRRSEPAGRRAEGEPVTMAQRVAVIGAGLMGSGIAQVSAVAGLDVTMRDINDQALRRGLDGIEKSLARFAGKGRISEADAQAALARIRTTTELEAAAEADIVVEAVFEDLAVKQELFGILDRICGPDAVLATNTSALPITQIGAATGRP